MNGAGAHETRDTGTGTTSVRVAPSDAEYFDPAMRAPLLKRIADQTDGRFFRANDTSRLVDAITYSGHGITVIEEKELWDMPIVLILLLGLMAAEWAYRRTRGWRRRRELGEVEVESLGDRSSRRKFTELAVGASREGKSWITQRRTFPCGWSQPKTSRLPTR